MKEGKKERERGERRGEEEKIDDDDEDKIHNTKFESFNVPLRR